jgi:hypothetical protein
LALRLLQDPQEKGATPTATGTRTKALTHLAGVLGLMDPDEINEFSLRDVKAEAYFPV